MPGIRQELQQQLDLAILALQQSCSPQERNQLRMALHEVNDKQFEKQAASQLETNNIYLIYAAKILAIYAKAEKILPPEALTQHQELSKLFKICEDHAPRVTINHQTPRGMR